MLQCFLQSIKQFIQAREKQYAQQTFLYSDILKEYEQQDNIFVYRFGLLLSAENEQAKN